MVKSKSRVMRIDRNLADAIDNKGKEIEMKIKIKPTSTQASGSLFKEFQEFKMSKLKFKKINF